MEITLQLKLTHSSLITQVNSMLSNCRDWIWNIPLKRGLSLAGEPVSFRKGLILIATNDIMYDLILMGMVIVRFGENR